MEYVSESTVRGHGDEAVNALLDVWHQECKAHFKRDIDVILADRTDNTQLRDIPGAIFGASPLIMANKMVLTIWVDTVDRIQPVMITHELGHWVLLLRGYKTMINPQHRPDETAVNLNALAHHPPLYELQQSIGHDPLELTDPDTERDVNFFNNMKYRDASYFLSDALRAADLMTTCSEHLRHRLEDVLKKRMPITNQYAHTILDVLETHNLTEPEKNLAFVTELLKELKLKDWVELDFTGRMAEHLPSSKE